MRVVIFCFGLALTACTQTPVSLGAPEAGDVLGSAQQAYFTERPDNLFQAAAALCDGPGQSVVKPNANEVRCESLPDPESAAALILQFGGTVEDLPTLVIDFAGRQTTEGYLLTIDDYARVPQRDGGVQLVRFNNEEVSAGLADLLMRAGGRPL